MSVMPTVWGLLMVKFRNGGGHLEVPCTDGLFPEGGCSIEQTRLACVFCSRWACGERGGGLVPCFLWHFFIWLTTGSLDIWGASLTDPLGRLGDVPIAHRVHREHLGKFPPCGRPGLTTRPGLSPGARVTSARCRRAKGRDPAFGHPSILASRLPVLPTKFFGFWVDLRKKVAIFGKFRAGAFWEERPPRTVRLDSFFPFTGRRWLPENGGRCAKIIQNEGKLGKVFPNFHKDILEYPS